MTDKQKQALLLITRLYNENKIGDGELCLLHECIFPSTSTPTYVPSYPFTPEYDPMKVWCKDGTRTYGISEERRDMNQQEKVWCTNVPTTDSDVEIPESILREIKDKRFQGD